MTIYRTITEYTEICLAVEATRKLDGTIGSNDTPSCRLPSFTGFHMAENQPDRRAFPRYIHRSAVGIAVLEIIDRKKGGRIQGARCCDLSRSGMRIRTERELSGSELRIKFLLPDGLDQTIDATAVRVEPIDRDNFEYGLEFHTLLPDDSFDGQV